MNLQELKDYRKSLQYVIKQMEENMQDITTQIEEAESKSKNSFIIIKTVKGLKKSDSIRYTVCNTMLEAHKFVSDHGIMSIWKESELSFYAENKDYKFQIEVAERI